MVVEVVGGDAEMISMLTNPEQKAAVHASLVVANLLLSYQDVR